MDDLNKIKEDIINGVADRLANIKTPAELEQDRFLKEINEQIKSQECRKYDLNKVLSGIADQH